MNCWLYFYMFFARDWRVKDQTMNCYRSDKKEHIECTGLVMAAVKLRSSIVLFNSSNVLIFRHFVCCYEPTTTTMINCYQSSAVCVCVCVLILSSFVVGWSLLRCCCRLFSSASWSQVIAKTSSELMLKHDFLRMLLYQTRNRIRRVV